MLFINRYSWDPEKRDEIIRRRMEIGTGVPEGVRVLGEWTAVGRNVGFMVVETDNAALLSQANMMWNDIMHTDIHLVQDTEKDLIPLLKKR